MIFYKSHPAIGDGFCFFETKNVNIHPMRIEDDPASN